MPTKKLCDLPENLFKKPDPIIVRIDVCKDPDHEVPLNKSKFSPGLYEHECSTCGLVKSFLVHDDNL